MPPSEKWGSKVIDNIANEINNKYPTLKGFNRAGLYRMMQFYDTYKDNEIVATLLRQISWSNNIAILSGTKTMGEKEFYIRMCIKNNYSVRELNRQILLLINSSLVYKDKCPESVRDAFT